MDTIYHIIIGIGLILASPVVLIKMIFNPKFREEVKARLFQWKELPKFRSSIWVHAASVGEVQMAKLFIRALQEKYEDKPIVLSTFSTTGFEVASEEKLCPTFQLPIDIIFLIRPLLKRLNPSVLILIEAEFWPALLRQCGLKGIPILLINGRMSERSFQQYKKIQPVFHWLTFAFYRFAMRSSADADRVRRLGTRKDKILVTGNMKFDGIPPVHSPNSSMNHNGSSTIVFGSTRPGDETIILDSIQKLKEKNPLLHFVLAPRHIQRTEEIEKMILKKGLDYQLHSQLKNSISEIQPSITLVDVLGKLNSYYKDAAVTFVGGGFNPEIGGHNILEPAVLGKPVVFGKHMNNFEEEARLLTSSGGGIQIDEPELLYPTLKDLIDSPKEIERRGKLAAQTIEDHRGAIYRNLQLVNEILTSPCLQNKGPFS